MLTDSKLRIVKITLVIIVIGIATYLRVGMPEIVEFKRDEANLSLLALDFANGNTFPLLGITSSVGFPNAPFNAYILAIPYFFSSSPVLATQFIGLLNVGAIVLSMWFVKRYTNIWVALGVGLLFAVSPWSVVFSRKIWAQNMLPLFVSLSLFSAYLGFIEKKRWAQICHLPLLVITGQIHYGAFVILPATFYIWWVGRKNIQPRMIGFSIIISGILLAPYIVGLANGGLLSPSALRESLSSSDDVQIINNGFAALREAGVLISGTEIHSFAGVDEFQNYLSQFPFDLYPVFNLLAISIAVACVYLLIQVVTGKSQQPQLVIMGLLWLIFPIVVYLINWTEFFIHYLIPILPIAFILLGIALYDAINRLNPGWRRLTISGGGVGLIIIATTQMIAVIALLQFVKTTYTPGGFGTPLSYVMPIRDYVDDYDDVIGKVGGQFIGFDGEPTVWEALLYDVPNVRFAYDSIDVYNEQGLLILDHQCSERPELRTFPLRAQDEGCYSAYEQSDLPDYQAVMTDLNTFANGVHVLGYNWTETCLYLAWQAEDSSERVDTFAVHFYDANENRLLVADQSAWLGRYWRANEVIFQSFCGDLTDVAQVTIGMYWLDGDVIQPIDLVDFLGNAQGRSIVIEK